MAMILQSVGRGAANSPSDVQLVQTLINQKISMLAPIRPLRVDGVVGPKTIAAIEAYQSRVVRMETPDGVVDPKGGTIKSLSNFKLSAENRPRIHLGSRQVEKPTPLWLSVAAGEANWLREATSQDGVSELAGHEKNNAKILEYLRSVGYLHTVETLAQEWHHARHCGRNGLVRLLRQLVSAPRSEAWFDVREGQGLAQLRSWPGYTGPGRDHRGLQEAENQRR